MIERKRSTGILGENKEMFFRYAKKKDERIEKEKLEKKEVK